jgi:pimeloyl-ACP methyl ester carboxylesterase
MRTNRRLPLLFICLLISIAAPAITPSSAQQKPEFEPVACYDTSVANTECGYLLVPEDRSKANSPIISIYVVILRSNNPAGTPVVYLEGGPGGAGSFSLEGWVDTPLAKNYDLILVDQRGSGYSEPSLNCDEMEDEALVDVDPVAECRDRLLDSGIDLNMYNSLESAADLADLRLALGYDSWNLLGISYGTRLALYTMKAHPEGLRSVILDAVYPPNIVAIEDEVISTMRVLNAIFDECARQVECAIRYPNLEQDFYTLIETANANPIIVEGYDSFVEETVTYELLGDDIMLDVFLALYDTSLVPLMARVLAEAAEGNYAGLGYIKGLDAEGYYGRFMRQPKQDYDYSDSEGLGYSVDCSEEVLLNDRETAYIKVRQEAPAALHSYFEYSIDTYFIDCETWGVQALPKSAKAAVKSNIPTLILNGQFDPITPPTWGDLAAKSLSKSYSFTFPYTGHSSTSEDCGYALILSFLANPSQAPKDSCFAKLTPPIFDTGSK